MAWEEETETISRNFEALLGEAVAVELLVVYLWFETYKRLCDAC